MKKLFAIVLLALSVFCLQAADVNISIGGRETASEYHNPFSSFKYETKDFSLGLRYHFPRQIDLTSTYFINPENKFKQSLKGQFTNLGDIGGTFTLSYNLGYDFLFFNDSLLLGIGGTAQAGLYYSYYVDRVSYSLTPGIKLNASFLSKIVDFDVYLSFSNDFERYWQAMPIIGFNLDIKPIDNITIGLFGYTLFSDYLLTPSLPSMVGYAYGLSLKLGGL